MIALPQRPLYDRAHPPGCHRLRISDRIVFDNLLQDIRFGCAYEAIADAATGVDRTGGLPGPHRQVGVSSDGAVALRDPRTR
jgi:hypothetical protein